MVVKIRTNYRVVVWCERIIERAKLKSGCVKERGFSEGKVRLINFLNHHG